MERVRGFTLVELLVVIAIISVLAAMLLPTLADALEEGRRRVCANNMRQMHIGLCAYAADFSDCLPLHGANGATSAGGVSTLDWLMSYFRTSSGYVFDPSTMVWAGEYCGAGEFIDREGNYPRFANTNNRGVFQCPSAKKIQPASPDVRISYRICFVPFIPLCADPALPLKDQLLVGKLTRAAAPSRGFEKAFFFDNLWETVGGVANTYNWNYNGHQPERVDGQNVCMGNGAVKWHDYAGPESGSFGHTLYKIPIDYWAPIGWALPRSDTGSGGISLFNPTSLTLIGTHTTGTPVYTSKDYGHTAWSNTSSVAELNRQTYWQMVRLWK